MSAPKFTPGPWGGADHIEIVPLTGPSSHCTLAYMPEPGKWFTPDEIKANSRLIVASPDLYAACQVALTTLTTEGGATEFSRCYAVQMIRAALRKAEGAS